MTGIDIFHDSKTCKTQHKLKNLDWEVFDNEDSPSPGIKADLIAGWILSLPAVKTAINEVKIIIEIIFLRNLLDLWIRKL